MNTQIDKNGFDASGRGVNIQAAMGGSSESMESNPIDFLIRKGVSK